jgi:hypothetical protein
MADLTLDIEIFIRIMSRSSLLSCWRSLWEDAAGRSSPADRLVRGLRNRTAGTWYFSTMRRGTARIRVCLNNQVDGAGSSWAQLGQTFYGKDGLDCSGLSIDLSPDGNTLAFGSPGYYKDGDRTGYVRVFALKVGIDNNIGTTHS